MMMGSRLARSGKGARTVVEKPQSRIENARLQSRRPFMSLHQRFSIRFGTAGDAATIHAFISALAEYEHLAHEVTASVDDLRRELFGETPRAEVVLAYENDTPVGFALFYHNFSTF